MRGPSPNAPELQRSNAGRGAIGVHMSGRLGPAAATSGTLAGCIVAAGRQSTRNTSPARPELTGLSRCACLALRAPKRLPDHEIHGAGSVLWCRFHQFSAPTSAPPHHLHTPRQRCFSAHLLLSRRPLYAPSTTPMFRHTGPRAVSEWSACLGADHEHMRAADGYFRMTEDCPPVGSQGCGTVSFFAHA